MKRRKILKGEVYPRPSQFTRKEIRAIFEAVAKGPPPVEDPDYPVIVTRKTATHK